MLNLPISIDLGLGPALNNLILLMAIMMFTAVLTIGIVALIYIASYRIRCVAFPTVGSGTSNALGVGKRKWQRFKWNRSRTAWKPLRPLFNRKEIEPFGNEYIYAGNNVMALELPDGKYIPLKLNLNPQIGEKKFDLKTMISEALPVPYYLSKWNEIELQQEELEFAEKGFWQENKHFIIALITIALCLLLVGLTIYLTFKFTGGKFDAILEQGNRWIDALSRTTTIPSK